MSELTEHARRNQAEWNRFAADFVRLGERNWAADEPTWGVWDLPESEVRALPDVNGLDVIELGCGTAYFSAWFARRGARPVGVDLSEKQLETARRLQGEHSLEFPLIHASAEDVPLPDDGFDLAFSEYGACLWCDPYLWIPEAARLLRPGGRLIFMTNSPLSMLCTPLSGDATVERLERPQFGMHRFEWPDDDSVEFHLPHGEMIRLLRENGFEVEALHELGAPSPTAVNQFENVPAAWASRWPNEEIWVARVAPA